MSARLTVVAVSTGSLPVTPEVTGAFPAAKCFCPKTRLPAISRQYCDVSGNDCSFCKNDGFYFAKARSMLRKSVKLWRAGMNCVLRRHRCPFASTRPAAAHSPVLLQFFLCILCWEFVTCAVSPPHRWRNSPHSLVQVQSRKFNYHTRSFKERAQDI